MKKLRLLFLIMLLSACSGKPTHTPESVCNKELLDRFLRTELPFNDQIWDTEMLSEYISLIFKASWEDYGATVEDQTWKIVLKNDKTCLVFQQAYMKNPSLNEGEIVLQPVFTIDIEEEIILPADEPSRFFYRNYLGDEAYVGVPLGP